MKTANCKLLVLSYSLIRGGTVTNVVDERGETPLHIAAERGRRAIVQTLLLFDADIDHVSRMFASCIMFCLAS